MQIKKQEDNYIIIECDKTELESIGYGSFSRQPDARVLQKLVRLVVSFVEFNTDFDPTNGPLQVEMKSLNNGNMHIELTKVEGEQLDELRALKEMFGMDTEIDMTDMESTFDLDMDMGWSPSYDQSNHKPNRSGANNGISYMPEDNDKRPNTTDNQLKGGNKLVLFFNTMPSLADFVRQSGITFKVSELYKLQDQYILITRVPSSMRKDKVTKLDICLSENMLNYYIEEGESATLKSYHIREYGTPMFLNCNVIDKIKELF